MNENPQTKSRLVFQTQQVQKCSRFYPCTKNEGHKCNYSTAYRALPGRGAGSLPSSQISRLESRPKIFREISLDWKRIKTHLTPIVQPSMQRLQTKVQWCSKTTLQALKQSPVVWAGQTKYIFIHCLFCHHKSEYNCTTTMASLWRQYTAVYMCVNIPIFTLNVNIPRVTQNDLEATSPDDQLGSEHGVSWSR